MSSDERLEALRAELDSIDDQILHLVAKRQKTVAAVREHKRAAQREVFDRAREQQVLRRLEARAGDLGLPMSPIRSLVEALFAASHQLQSSPDPQRASETRRFAIVGGEGRMGRLFAEWLEERGHAVDRLETVSPEAVAAAEVVLIAVPIEVSAEVTAEVAPLVSNEALLCDINSLKTDVCEAMEACPGEALGMHPLFGPTTKSLRRQKIVLCEVRPGPRSRWLAEELGRMGAELIHTDADTHDRMMAVVQVLTHFGIMTMGRALAAARVPIEGTLRFTSPIYRLELSIVGRLFSQDPHLYREIMMRNPHGGALRRRFVEEAQQLAAELDRGDDEAFVEAFEGTSRFFREFSQEAMDLSDLIIERVMSRP